MKKPDQQEKSSKGSTSKQQEQSQEIQEATAIEEHPILSTSMSRRPPILSRSLTAPAGVSRLERTDSVFSASFSNAHNQDLSFEIAAEVSQAKEAMKGSFRGGITNTKKTAERRVVEVPSLKSKRQKLSKGASEGDSELKDAIKNISKPNRIALAE